MSHDSPQAGEAAQTVRAWQGWLPLTVVFAFCTVLLAIMMWRRGDSPAKEPSGDNPPPVVHRPMKLLPQPPTDAGPMTHARTMPQLIDSDVSGASDVFRIRTHANGDEMIVDTKTGRLLAVRDSSGRTIPWVRVHPTSKVVAPEHAVSDQPLAN